MDKESILALKGRSCKPAILVHSLLKLLTYFTHYHPSGPETVDKSMLYNMVLIMQVVFLLIRSAPRTWGTYSPGRVTEVYLQPPHGPNDSNNWLDGVTVDHCFVLFTFLFWITSFMDNSNKTKWEKLTLTSFDGTVHLNIKKFNVLNLLTSSASQLYFSQIHQHLKKGK